MHHQSADIGKLAEALSKAQAEMRPAKKDTENPFFKSKYADLASIWDAIREPLAKNGLAVTQLPMSVTEPSDTVGLMTMLAHSSGEFVSSYFVVRPVKNDPQAIGSALTYARRYALSAITGVATEDDDAEVATHQAPPVRGSSAPAPHQPTPELPSTPCAGVFTWRLGKYKGTPLSDLETGYLEWFAQNGNVQDHRAAAIMELDRRAGQETVGYGEDALPDLIEQGPEIF